MAPSSSSAPNAAAGEVGHSPLQSGEPATTRSRRLNVVELGKHFPPQYFGGIEVMTELSARALASEYNVTVICHNIGIGRKEKSRDGYRIVRCSTQLKWFLQPIS